MVGDHKTQLSQTMLSVHKRNPEIMSNGEIKGLMSGIDRFGVGIRLSTQLGYLSHPKMTSCFIPSQFGLIPAVLVSVS